MKPMKRHRYRHTHTAAPVLLLLALMLGGMAVIILSIIFP